MDTGRFKAIVREALEDLPEVKLKGVSRKSIAEFETWVIRLDAGGREVRFEVDCAGQTDAAIAQRVAAAAKARG